MTSESEWTPYWHHGEAATLSLWRYECDTCNYSWFEWLDVDASHSHCPKPDCPGTGMPKEEYLARLVPKRNEP